MLNESPWKRPTLILAALLAAGAIAGCVEEPQEADQESPIADEEPAAGDEPAAFEEIVIISDVVYRCDTTLETTDAVEGVCDEYQIQRGEDPMDFADAPIAQVVDDDTVLVQGMTYRCDEQFLGEPGVEEDPILDDEPTELEDEELEAEPCEEYVIEGAAE